MLVVDDSAAQRRVLTLALRQSGYAVSEAGSGAEAWNLCQNGNFDIILSDWVMPGMTGPELCSRVRGLPRDAYGYFILLTSKSDKAEVADGLNGGADDFLSKPISPAELRARMRAGERILSMHDQLVEKNRMIGSTLDKLQAVYDSLDRDLIEARKLQQTLFRDRQRDFGQGRVTILMRQSGHVGGDLVGCFSPSPRHLSFYSIDVAGHGVTSAMMTARLAGFLAGVSTEVAGLTSGQRDRWPPEVFAARLNRMMIDDMRVDSYFTLALAEVDLQTGKVLLVQAGHPHPAILRSNGRVDFLGSGGLPIGLIPDARFDRVETHLEPGDRMLLFSDGVTECVDPAGREFGEAGLADSLSRSAGLHGEALLDVLIDDLKVFSGVAQFRDDVSGVLFDYRGPASNSASIARSPALPRRNAASAAGNQTAV
ncbi:PP2C family protein-serine/threonine phosphatase [Alitabrizicola rongguiensis]|uniref:PP2C family protein-serine/threonine phosphatase n=1 Tax=Alitabrizicola rongguiensis TaxID=2909234 RepID=UPI001F424476|nr:SpoIIE family protein phosphatase [Tabrizicola rongguiensis]